MRLLQGKIDTAFGGGSSNGARLRVLSLPDVAEDALRRGGIERGMRVLDLECGAGCAALLIAKLVGPTGLVVGVDRSQAAVVQAERRATIAGFCYWTRFVTADPCSFVPPEKFQVVIVRQPRFHQHGHAAYARFRASVFPDGAIMFVSSEALDAR